MLKIVLVSVVGFAVLGWFVSNPDTLFDGATEPPTIRAEPGSFKHRPNNYTAAQSQPQVAGKSLRGDPQDIRLIDVNLFPSR